LKEGSRTKTDHLWTQLLNLGEQLVHQPAIAEQRTLVEKTASQLLDSHAQLWLDPHAFQLPGEDLPFPEQTNPSPITQAALQSRRIQREANPPRLGVPLINQDLLLGVLELIRPDGPGFKPAEINLVERLAAYSAVSIQVTRQAMIKNWRSEQLSLVRSVSAQIANVMDLDELSRQVTRLICDTFHYYYVGLFTLDPGQDVLQFRASALPKRRISRPTKTPVYPPIHLGQGLVGQVAQNGEEILAENVQEEPRYRYDETLPETRSEIALPLKFKNRILGVLDIQSNQEQAFHEVDILVLRALADNIALAVEGTRLYEDLRRRAEQVSVVGEVSRAITSILDLDTLLDEVIALIQKRFKFPFIHLFTVHSGRRKIVYRAGSGSRSQALREMGVSYDLDDALGIIPWVARNGKTMLANDVTAEPLYRPSDLPPQNTRSELAIPLIFGGEVLGVLDVQSDRRNAFAEDDRFLLEALGDNISIAIRNAMMYRSERWRRQVAESLRDVAALLSSEVGLNQVLETILSELERSLPCDVAAIWLLEENPAVHAGENEFNLRLAAVTGSDKQTLGSIGEIAPESEALLNQAVTLEHPRIRSNQDPPGPIGAALNYPPDYSSLAAPLRNGDQPLGVLAIAHHTPARYGDEAVSMVGAFASYAAVAIENNRLYTSAQEQAWVSTIMLQVTEATQTITSVDELLNIVARLTPMLVRVNSCAILQWSPSSNAYFLAAEYELASDLVEILRDPSIHPETLSTLERVRTSLAPVIIDEQDFDLSHGSENNRSIILLPILARGDFLGVFLVQQDRKYSRNASQEEFEEQQLRILQGIIQQTAIAVENIRLLESKQEEAYVTAVLLQVAQAVVSLNNLNDILEAIVHIMPILVGIDNCIIYLYDPAHELFRPTHVYSGTWRVENNLMAQLFSPGEYPILDQIFQSDTFLVTPIEGEFESPDDWHRIPSPDAELTPDSVLDYPGSLLMGFPLSVKGEVLGIMLTQEAGTAREFRERRLEIITGIAQQAALAIQNEHLTRERFSRERLEQEIQLARNIQRTFLPSRIPSPPGWDLDVRWRTARQVGGDFYDCFELPGDRLGLVIADVSDKGMPAALYMTVTRTLIRATAQENDSPASVLMRVNNLLLMDSHSGMFVTAVYAILSVRTGELVYSIAGHNLPVWYHQHNHEIESLEKGGVVLGAWENIPLQDHRLQIHPGDCLIFYTDGVTEAFSQTNEAYGEQRLNDAIQNAQDSSAMGVLNAIDASLTEFLEEAPQSDDITLLALHRPPETS